MVDGRQRDQWNHTAQVLAMLYNAFRGSKARPLGPADFHPLVKKPAATTTLKQLSELGILNKAEDCKPKAHVASSCSSSLQPPAYSLQPTAYSLWQALLVSEPAKRSSSCLPTTGAWFEA